MLLCLRNVTCHKNTLFCCYSCEVECETNNNCNDEECEYNPNSIENEKEQDITKDEDIKLLLEELLKSARYADVDFQKISEIAKRNGYEIDDDLDLVKIDDE